MKILLPTVDYFPKRGGVARYLKGIVDAFPGMVEPLVLPDDIGWKAARRALLEHSRGYDAIWVNHIFPLGTAAMLTHFKTGKRYSIFLHGMDFDLARRTPGRRFLAKVILRVAEHVVTNSQALADEVRAFCGRQPIVVYPCVSGEMLDLKNPRKSPIGGKVGLTLLTVARLVERKGHINVIQAIAKMPSVLYRIVGDGPMRETLEQVIAAEGLGDRVTIESGLTDTQLADAYRNADIFVMPTAHGPHDREGFGIVYLEAGLFGLPVIASNERGVDEAVIDGETGILVNGSQASLISAIEHLGRDPGLRQKLGQQGHDRVMKQFTPEAFKTELDKMVRPDQIVKLSEPLISVIIPTYQHAATLTDCIDSVLAQTYKNIEVIVVDDGSTDGTSDVLKSYERHIKIVRQPNSGSNPARNRGWREARGEFIIFCDADVRMPPEMIATHKANLDAHPEASYAYSAFTFGWKAFHGVPFDREKLRARNFIHTTSLIRAGDFPGFDESIKRLQDWDVWLSMLEMGHVGVLTPDIKFNVAVHGHSRIGSSWLPSFMHAIPWGGLGWKPRAIATYEAARAVIVKKHHL